MDDSLQHVCSFSTHISLPLPRHRDDWNVAVFGIGFGPHRHFTVLHYPARREDWGPCVCVDRAVGGGGGGGGGLKGNVLPAPHRKFGPETWGRGPQGAALYSAEYRTPGGGSPWTGYDVCRKRIRRGT